jgi:hypothetical protein
MSPHAGRPRESALWPRPTDDCRTSRLPCLSQGAGATSPGGETCMRDASRCGGVSSAGEVTRSDDGSPTAGITARARRSFRGIL